MVWSGCIWLRLLAYVYFICGLYDAILSSSKYMASNIRMKPNNEWERMWEKVVVA
jgi:hypothetical protein